ncbi:MAG TPA: hypothetical protein VKA70_18210 [Blastocatellia bacterium]|nr:hypothetical protein [Blastocatellia bacterium]
MLSFCRDGCSRTLFFCENCRLQSNHPLARYCRRCGEPISFENIESRFENGFYLDDPDGTRYSYKLSPYGITTVHALKSFRGHLIVVADRSVLVFDVHNLLSPLLGFKPPDNAYIQGVTQPLSSDDDRLIVTTDRNVYYLGLMDKGSKPFSIHNVAETRVIRYPVIRLGEKLLVFEYDQLSKTSWLIQSPDSVLAQFNGPVLSPTVISDDKVFFFTQREALLYNSRTDSVISKELIEPLRESPPAFIKEVESIYAVGERMLWRFDLGNETLVPTSLPTKHYAEASLSAKDFSLIVAHSSGLCLLDAFGSIKWDSSKEFIEAQSDGLPPQLYGNYFTFSSIGRLGGTVLRIHRLDNPSSFRDQFVFDKRLLCAPLLTLGKLIVAVGDGLSAELLVFNLERP